MKILPLIAAMALVLGSGCATAQDAHGHAGHAAHHGVMEIPADHEPWAPDAPLMAGMRRVGEAVHALHHHEMGHLGDGQVLSLAGEVDDAIAYMFANCSLEPEPDIALHGLLARLMAGTRDLKEDPAAVAPVAGMRAAVEDYPKLFEDPGFNAEIAAGR